MIKSFDKIERDDKNPETSINWQEITEKVDGSQITWTLSSRTGLEVRSKNMSLYQTDHFTQESNGVSFRPAIEYLISVEYNTLKDIQYYAEYLSKPRHNAIKYDRIPKNHLMLFAAKWETTGIWANHQTLTNLAEYLDIDVAPLAYKIDQKSYLGGTMEGVVLSHISEDGMTITKRKVINKEFEEVKQSLKDKKKLGKSSPQDDWKEFKERFRTEARWQKAIIHLKESGQLTNSLKDIGLLMKEVTTDLLKEESDTFNNYFNKNFRKELLKHSCNGIKEYYEKQLEDNDVQDN